MADESSIKIGAAISQANMAKIQSAHDTMTMMGAKCDPANCDQPDPEMDMEDPVATDNTPKSFEPSDTVVNFGGSVKFIETAGGWKFKAPLVVFTNPNDVDLTGDYFDASTDFDMDFPGKSTTYFNHGMDSHFKLKRLQPATLTKDEFGVWAEGILKESDEYENFLIELGKSGKLGMSSGVPGHLVETEKVGKAQHIKYWPLGKDASYTHTPAEPKTRYIVPLKSLIIGDPPQEPLGALAETVTKNIVSESPLPKEGKPMPELTEDQLKAFAVSAVEEYKRTEPAMASAGAVSVVVDASDQPFKSAGEYFMAVKNAALNPNGEDVRLRPLKAAAGMNEGNPADGGYLVAPQYAPGIYTNMFGVGEILSRINVINTSGNDMTWNMVDETTRAGSRFGGVLGYWLAEAGTKTASAPKFKQLTLKLKKVAALAYATDELLADSSALQGWLTTNVPDELRFQVEAAIVQGDGVGKPTGIVGAPGTVSVTRVDGSKVQLADVLAMYARRLGNGPYVWLINREVLGQLMQLAGTYQYLWMPPGALADTPNSRLLGYPVIESEYCSALGTVGDIILADMSKYQAIQKGGVETASSIHVRFTTDETAYRFVYRFDGAPMLSSAITPYKATSGATMSPFVTLSTSS